jgi:hypothetical protein
MARLHWDATDKKGVKIIRRGTVCYGEVWHGNITKKYESFDFYFPVNGKGVFSGAYGTSYTTNEIIGIFAFADRAGLKNVCKGIVRTYTDYDLYRNKPVGEQVDAIQIHVPTKGQSGITIRTLMNIVRTTCEAGLDKVGKHFLRFCEEGGPEPILNKLLVAHYAAQSGMHHSMRPHNAGLFELHDDAWYAKHILRTRRVGTTTIDYFPYRQFTCTCGYPQKYDNLLYAECGAHGGYAKNSDLDKIRTAILAGKRYEECKALYVAALEKTQAPPKPRKVKA